MKQLLILGITLLSSTISSAKAADLITCIGPQKAKLILTRTQTRNRTLQAGQIRFEIELDKALSSKYLGEIFDRSIAVDKKDPNRVLSGSDGNSSIAVTFETLDFISAKPGTLSTAWIEIRYDDISTDYVKNRVECSIEK